MARSFAPGLAVANCMRSKMIGLAAILIVCACIAHFVAIHSPEWFKVHTNQDRLTGKVSAEYSTGEGIGLYGYVDYTGKWININMLQKATNRHIVPDTMIAAQVFYLLGAVAAGVCMVTLIILAMAPYTYVTAEICTAGAVTASAACCSLAVILSAIATTTSCDTVMSWCQDLWLFKMYTFDSFSWGFFIAIIACGITIVAAVMVWLQACSTCKSVERMRSKPLKHLDDEPRYYKFDYRKIPKVEYSRIPTAEPAPVGTGGYVYGTAYPQHYGYHAQQQQNILAAQQAYAYHPPPYQPAQYRASSPSDQEYQEKQPHYERDEPRYDRNPQPRYEREPRSEREEPRYEREEPRYEREEPRYDPQTRYEGPRYDEVHVDEHGSKSVMI